MDSCCVLGTSRCRFHKSCLARSGGDGAQPWLRWLREGQAAGWAALYLRNSKAPLGVVAASSGTSVVSPSTATCTWQSANTKGRWEL